MCLTRTTSKTQAWMNDNFKMNLKLERCETIDWVHLAPVYEHIADFFGSIKNVWVTCKQGIFESVGNYYVLERSLRHVCSFISFLGIVIRFHIFPSYQ